MSSAAATSVTLLALMCVASGFAAAPVASESLGTQPGAASVSIHVSGNRTFYWAGRRLRYLVVTQDPLSGDSLHGSLPSEYTAVYAGSVSGSGPTPAAFFASGGISRSVDRGRALVKSADCLLCHTVDESGVIPNLTLIGAQARDKPTERARLEKIISTGSTTAVGGIQMPAHPNLSSAEVGDLADYIVSLRAENENPRLMPGRGELRLSGAGLAQPPIWRQQRSYVLAAAYDRGGIRATTRPTATAELRLREPLLFASEADDTSGTRIRDLASLGRIAVAEHAGAYVAFFDVDLTGIATVYVLLAQDSKPQLRNAGRLVLRLDGTDGREAGEAVIDDNTGIRSLARVAISLDRTEGFHRLFLVTEDSATHKSYASLAAIEFLPAGTDDL